MKARFLPALVIALGLIAAPAFAHGGMVETSIHDQAKFAAAPASLKVTFEHDSAIASVSLMTADKKPLAIAFTPSKAFGKEYTIPLPPLSKGSYVLSWKALAKDGHAMPGAIRFTVAGS